LPKSEPSYDGTSHTGCQSCQICYDCEDNTSDSITCGPFNGQYDWCYTIRAVIPGVLSGDGSQTFFISGDCWSILELDGVVADMAEQCGVNISVTGPDEDGTITITVSA